jgi:exo-1,4-beta-D-glucosaminidase
LLAADGRAVSTNFYWLSTRPEELDFPRTKWYVTPARSYADFTALRTLPTARVSAAVRFTQEGSEEIAHVTLSNPGPTLAFFLRLQVVDARAGEEVLPVLWEDNYLSLLPGETREVSARYRPGPTGTARTLVVSGWNVPRVERR